MHGCMGFFLNELFGIFAFSMVTDILRNMNNKEGNIEDGQDSIHIKDVARWLVKLAAADGVVSVSERKLLSEFANAFSLDKNALYRMAHGYANNVDIPEVESVSRCEMVGRKFEEFVVKLMSDKSIFRLLAWRSDKIVDGTYAAENLMPDLHLRHRLDVGEVEYFVECKFRSLLVDGVLDLGPQLNRYRRMSSGELFIALGVGGAPSNPDKLYMIPSRMIKGDSIIHLENFSKCLCPKDTKGIHEYISRFFKKRVL